MLGKTRFRCYLNKQTNKKGLAFTGLFGFQVLSPGRALAQRDGGWSADVPVQRQRPRGRGVPKWNLPPCGPGDFVWRHVCAAAAREDGPASSPYINHHMSSSLNKMECLLCFPWTPNHNKSTRVLPPPWQFLSGQIFQS